MGDFLTNMVSRSFRAGPPRPASVPAAAAPFEDPFSEQIGIPEAEDPQAPARPAIASMASPAEPKPVESTMPFARSPIPARTPDLHTPVASAISIRDAGIPLETVEASKVDAFMEPPPAQEIRPVAAFARPLAASNRSTALAPTVPAPALLSASSRTAIVKAVSAAQRPQPVALNRTAPAALLGPRAVESTPAPRGEVGSVVPKPVSLPPLLLASHGRPAPVRQASLSEPHQSPPETVVNVTIGRIEVRADAPRAAKSGTPQQPPSFMGLDEYARRRNGGRS